MFTPLVRPLARPPSTVDVGVVTGLGLGLGLSRRRRVERSRARRRIIIIMHSRPHFCARAVMLTFCPTCGTLLSLEREDAAAAARRADVSRASTSSAAAAASGVVVGGVRLRCASCPYAYEVTSGVKQRVEHAKKTVDDVLGGEEAWKNVDKTSATCPKCAHDLAYFMQIQIRSADEPMSTFYKCARGECAHQWREG